MVVIPFSRGDLDGPKFSKILAKFAAASQCWFCVGSISSTPASLPSGADDVTQLKELEEDEFQQLCLMVGMASKPFHVKRLQKALGRPSTQVYSQKRLETNDPSNFPRQPDPRVNNPGGTSRLFPTDPNIRVIPSPTPRLPLPPKLPQTSSLPPALQRYQQKQFQSQHEAMTSSHRTLSPDKEPSNLDLCTQGKSPSKQLFLPRYLLPDSDSNDITPLVDEMTPIQAELGPCPFKPADWDERRAELVRRYAAIYGQGNSKRKNEELSLHEENINVAAFQLCLRDPTLLVRRDELLILSRKAIKDGGYVFQQGTPKAKVNEAQFVASTHKRPIESPPSPQEGLVKKNIDIPASTMSLPRNMSREKKLKRVEELEFLITKNKMKQSIKLTALEKARQGNDFSMSYHLQGEIESLGNVLANLQYEYANMKYRLRRSDRYFEKKHLKGQDVLEERLVHRVHVPDIPGVEVAPKRMRTHPPSESGATPTSSLQLVHSSNHRSSFYQPPTSSRHPQPSPHSDTTSPQTNTVYVNSSTPGSASENSSIVTATATVSISHPSHSSSSSSHPLITTTSTTSPPALLHISNKPPPSSSSTSSLATSDLPPVFPQRYPPATTSTSQYLNDTPKVMGQVTSQRESPPSTQLDPQTNTTEDEDIPSNQLLANINKLATQAAANLRSLPHF